MSSWKEREESLTERRGAGSHQPWKPRSGRVVVRPEGLLRTETLTTEQAWWLPGAVAWTSGPLAASSPFLTMFQVFKKTWLYPQMPGQCCLLPVRREILISLVGTESWGQMHQSTRMRRRKPIKTRNTPENLGCQGFTNIPRRSL